MYVGRVNGPMMKCRVVETTSTGDNLFGKVVRTVDGARGPVGEVDSGDESSNPEDVIKPKNKA